jgi:two-component system KDP operon response regulator KdpE
VKILKVLIIEDDQGIVEAISLAFQIRWPEAKLISVHLGEKGVELVESEDPDIVILDLGLPDITGFDVLKQIRLFSSVPVIILTVRSEEPDVVKGLEWGADDYVVKPFRQLELLSRIKALTRRQADLAEETVVSYGPLRLNTDTRELTNGEREISLTVTESRILQKLIKNEGRVVTHSNLAESVWGEDYEDATNALKVYIRRIRQKVEEDPSHPILILTKAGIGYQLGKRD